MESGGKQQRLQRARRRERAQQLQEKPSVKEEMDESPPRTSKGKGRPKPRRRRNSSNSYEEDIIDGFAIFSFKSLTELENSIKSKNNLNNLSKKSSSLRKDVNSKSADQSNRPARPSSPTNDKQKQNKKKGKKNSNQTLNNKIASGVSSHPSSEGALQINGPSRSASRDRLSDASTHSSSGRGYWCDSEPSEEDDRASDAGSELFNIVSHPRENSVPSLPPPPPLPSPAAPSTVRTVTPPTINHIVPLVPSPVPTVTIPTTTTTTSSASSTSSTTVTTATTTTLTTSTGTAPNPSTVCRPPSHPVSHPSKPPIPVLPPCSQVVPRPVQVTNSPKKVQHHQPPCSLPPPLAVHREPPRVTPVPIARPPHRREEPQEAHTHHHKDPLDFVKTSNWVSTTCTSSSLHNSTSSLHNSVHRSPGLNSHPSLPIHSPHRPPHHSSPFPAPAHHHPPPPQPLHAHHHPPAPHPSPHSMFAPPLPPPAAAAQLTPASSTPLPAHGPVNAPIIGGPDAMSFHTNQELQQELNRRFLETHTPVERSNPATPSRIGGALPYIRQDIHQHQHMHQHQHTHQHTYGPVPPPHQFPGSLVPTPSPHVYDKMPKFDSPFYGQNVPAGIPNYPGIPSMLHPSGPGPINSGVHGAFQPKKVNSSSLHPATVMMSMRGDRDKSAPPSSLPLPKKTGKWCAMHVRVAWEIYHHQQKQQADQQKSSEGKSMEPLRPPGHLMGSMHRPPDLATQALLGAAAHTRSPFDAGPPPGSFLNPAHLGVSPYPRPFAALGPGGLSFGHVGNGFFSGDRAQLPGIHMPGVTPPQEWNRLHRTPPSFPTPPAWPKPDAEREREKEREREQEKERERERVEKERERERERQKERERELNASSEKLRGLGDRERERHVRHSPHTERHGGLDLQDKSREQRDNRTDKYHQPERQHSRSRSRSRSPLRNGRPEPMPRMDGMYTDKGGVKVKQERSEEEMHILNMQMEREKMIQNDYLMRGFAAAAHHSAAGPMTMNLLERSRMLAPPYSLPPDRVHPGVWNPLMDKSLDMNHQRLEFQREMERERDRMLMRLNPLNPLNSMLEHDQRLKEQEMIYREQRAIEASRREIMERFQPLERERLERMEMERGKIPPLRGPDPLALMHHGQRAAEMLNHAAAYHRPISPFINHHSSSKNGSPASIPPGAPPPLIPSLGNATQSRSRSPMNKSKTCSPTDSNSESKDRRDTSSTDPELHSR